MELTATAPRTDSVTLPDGTIVHQTRTIGTALTVTEAWEPACGHTTVRYFDAYAYGLVTSRPIPARVESMRPGSPERLVSTRDYRQALRSYALGCIAEAFPGLATEPNSSVQDGRILSN